MGHADQVHDLPNIPRAHAGIRLRLAFSLRLHSVASAMGLRWGLKSTAGLSFVNDETVTVGSAPAPRRDFPPVRLLLAMLCIRRLLAMGADRSRSRAATTDVTIAAWLLPAAYLRSISLAGVFRTPRPLPE